MQAYIDEDTIGNPTDLGSTIAAYRLIIPDGSRTLTRRKQGGR